jgi:DNA invertase Pin-like site-specific DNA recombinase
MDVIGYVRVSTDKQAESGLGQEAQLRAIESCCTQRGWTLVGVEQDVMSAKAMDGRDGLERAISACRAGEGEAIIIAKLDRLIRSVSDFALLLERSRSEGWGIVALDLAGVDTTTPMGEFMATVVAAVAQLERRIIGERTSAALQIKIANGELVGRKPDTSPELIAKFKELREKGWSYRRIAQLLNLEGVPTARGGACWRPEGVQRALRRAA